MFVAVTFPLAVGVAAGSSFGALLADDMFGRALTELLQRVIQRSFYVRVIAQDVTDFIGMTLTLATVVTLLTTSRLAPLRYFACLVIFAVPVFVGIQEYFFTRDDLQGDVLENLQEYFYYRWDVIPVAMGIVGALWWTRAYVAHRWPGALSAGEWQATASTGAKAFTSVIVVATLSIAAAGFLWLRDLSLMGC